MIKGEEVKRALKRVRKRSSSDVHRLVHCDAIKYHRGDCVEMGAEFARDTACICPICLAKALNEESSE